MQTYEHFVGSWDPSRPFEELSQYLDEMGSKGWYVVASFGGGVAGATLIFRRPTVQGRERAEQE